MKKLILLKNFIILAFLYSCAPLGSRTKIYNDFDFKQENNYAVLTFSDNENIPDKFNNIIDSAFQITIENRLDSLKINYKFFISSLLDFEKVKEENFSDIKIDSEIFYGFDYLLICIRKIRKPLGLHADSDVKLYIISKDRKLFIKSKHNTDLGNSYWLNPPLPQTLIDATNGAFNSLEKKLKKNK